MTAPESAVTKGDPAGGRQRVAVVTGGGGGIGAAIAEELGRSGAYVVTVDPLVSVDGAERLPAPEETTAGRIIAAGGSARASSASVTDAPALHELFAELVDEFGALDAVVNVAGITRPTSFTRGSEQDWRHVLSVHLDGYRNVLEAALPPMVEAGSGHILGVTSGSGWRAADTGAYGCAKRAVASLTWQVGRCTPPGVVVNAMSPIAMTRMVTAALKRNRTTSPDSDTRPDAKPSGRKASSTGGLSLGSMPDPADLGPLAAHLVADGFSAGRGQVLFTAGTEMAVVEEPRLLEVIPSGDPDGLAGALEVATTIALAPSEVVQQSSGGGNPRLGATFGPDGQEATDLPDPVSRSCVVVSDGGELPAAVAESIEVRGVKCRHVQIPDRGTSFEEATGLIGSSEPENGPDAVVLVAGSRNDVSPGVVSPQGWEGVLGDHVDIVEEVHSDAVWARAVAGLSKGADRPIRLVTLLDATDAGGRSRAQASAQLARSSLGATDQRVAAFSVGVESAAAGVRAAAGETVAHLVCSREVLPLVGAELMIGDGTIGLRSHPRVGASVAFAGTSVPEWFDDVLGSIVR
ncbi:MAG: SDR family NAD(P)-dependent oxidoreductase [Microthrixaceae bacterium]